MEFLSIFEHTLMITFFVFVMMLLVDFVDIVTNQRISDIIKGGKFRQYTLSSFFGAIPGCLGAFMNVSLYVRGIIGFGAIVGGMIATSGDEAFVMLAEFPGTALILFGLLFVCGIIFASISEKIVDLFGISTCNSCVDAECVECVSDMEKNLHNNTSISDILKFKNILINFRPLSFTRFLLLVLIISFAVLTAFGDHGHESWGFEHISFIILSICTFLIIIVVSEHYLHHHIWEHILKKHIFRVFLWSFGALFFVHWGLSHWDLALFVKQNMWLVLVISALISVIPESGPHLIFVMMFSQGLIPFSVLFTSSFVQDGHGILPLLSYSVKDAVLIKVFNLGFGLSIGGILFVMGF
ncbi:MAG: selenocysteine protein [Desulfobacteraceae bacterium]|nr:selenocysteine protein [Desulfobacteraceae bacterium]